jgi:hypothetical protein
MDTTDLRLRADHAELQTGLNLPPEAAVWAIRLFLDRDPLNDDEVRLLCAQPDLAALRQAVQRLAQAEPVDSLAEARLVSEERRHWRDMADSLHNHTRSPTSLEAAGWAFRLFLNREPRFFEELRYHRQHPDLAALRHAFLSSPEFRDSYTWPERNGPFHVPRFLMQPPADQRIPWHFAPPTIARPVSQVCTDEQFREPEYERLCAIHKTQPNFHRKQWEFLYIHSVLEKLGMLAPGRRLLGFGTGTEPLPSIFASFGADVLATDAPMGTDEAQGWSTTAQHSSNVEDLFKPHLVSREAFDAHVSFAAADMNDIPDSLQGFDACWSACAFEHLGSIEHGLRFYENSLKTLKPGGIAVHTTEFNISSNEETMETPGLSLFRRQDFERMLGRLLDAGHEVMPFNTHPGNGPGDLHIDAPPWSGPHIRVEAGRYVITSIGLVTRRRA